MKTEIDPEIEKLVKKWHRSAAKKKYKSKYKRRPKVINNE